MAKKKIVVVLTGTEKYPDLNRATGIWLGEVVHLVDKVEKAGSHVDYVSPEGGYTGEGTVERAAGGGGRMRTSIGQRRRFRRST